MTSNQNRVATWLLLLLPCLGFAGESTPNLVVHEWGTFTSVQGGDGVLLEWQPFVAKDLPAFVYSWQRPGLGRQMPLAMQFGKGGIRSLQRMETPVIYFYTDRELNADVTVKFPGGFITEWYPQAQEVGSENLKLPERPETIFAMQGQPLKNGVISWREVRVIPSIKPSDNFSPLVSDGTDNHYFAARETDSAFVRLETGGTNGSTPELEKLLFYRGAGNFSTPLKVTVSDNSEVAVENTGGAPLADLFLVQVRNGEGMWSYMGKIARHSRRPWKKLGESKTERFVPAEKFQTELTAKMESSLVAAGLYQREAAAMVKTWVNAWFTEDGVRVFYILPREWTDATLPLTLNPQPEKLVRVMVGRAEIISPGTQKDIATQISLVNKGDSQAQQRLQEFATRLGRFYGPAWQLANNMERSRSFE